MGGWRDIHVPARAAPLVPAILAGGVGLVVLFVGRGLDFRHDEWTFLIQRRDVTVDSLLVPWNEHLVLVPSLLYAILVDAFGVRSYLPFLAPVVILHVGLVAGSYLLLRRPLGAALAAGAAVILAVPGAGAENVLWAFQVTFLASLAGSMVAAAGARAARPTLVARTATVGGAFIAVASSSVGLFAVGSLLLWAIGHRRRSAVIDLIVPLIAWLAWFVTYGRAGILSVGHPLSTQALSNVIPYVSQGVANGFGDAFAVGVEFGAVAASCAAVLLAFAWIRGHDVRGPAAFVIGILAMYVAAALFRSQEGIDEAAPGRYVYVLEVFVILGLALLPTVRGFPSWVRSPRTAPLLVGLVLVVSVGHALTAVGVASQFAEASSAVRTRLAVADALWATPDLDPDALVLPEPWLDVTVSTYKDLVRDAGSPAMRTLQSIPDLPIEQRLIADEEIFTLLHGAFTWRPDDGSGVRVAPDVVETVRGAWAADASCGTFAPTGGDPWISFRLGSGARIAVTSSSAATLSVYPVVFGTFQSPILLTLDVAAGKPMTLDLPRLPGSLSWLVRLDSPADALSICEIR